MFRAGWSCVGVIDDVAPGGWMAAHAGDVPVVVTRSAEGELQGLPQRLPAPGCARGRRVRDRPRAALPVPRVELPARRLAGDEPRDGGRRRLRPRRTSACSRWASPSGRGSCSSARSPSRRRSTSVRSRPPSTRTPRERARARPAQDHRAGLQLEAAARELLGELPHPVGPPAAHLAAVGVPRSSPTARWCWRGTDRSTRRVRSRRRWPTPRPMDEGWRRRGRHPDRRGVPGRGVLRRVPQPAREHVPALPRARSG